jgi:uncharacterized protein
MELLAIAIEKPTDSNVLIGQSHFIKTVEDLHEALVTAVPGIRFGLAFCEASGAALVRASGTSPELVEMAGRNAYRIGAGHSFIILLDNAYPVNVLNAVKAVPEVCTVFCATANEVQVMVAHTETGRAILGVVDGCSPKGVETENDVADRKALLRRFGYKM